MTQNESTLVPLIEGGLRIRRLIMKECRQCGETFAAQIECSDGNVVSNDICFLCRARNAMRD